LPILTFSALKGGEGTLFRFADRSNLIAL
jgi:hypothetical protein